jgi:hypothetical protein
MTIQINLRMLLIGAVVCTITGAAGWNCIRAPKTVTKTVEVVKTETKFITNPDKADFSTLQRWAKSPIQIEYKPGELNRDYTALTVRAFDANKETVEEIRVPIYQNADWKVYVGIGAGVAVATIAGFEYWRKRAR